MPELPEVETTRRGISKYVVGKRITNILIRERRLRWLIPKNLKEILLTIFLLEDLLSYLK